MTTSVTELAEFSNQLAYLSNDLAEQINSRTANVKENYYAGVIRRTTITLIDIRNVLTTQNVFAIQSVFILSHSLLNDHIILSFLRSKDFTDEDLAISDTVISALGSELGEEYSQTLKLREWLSGYVHYSRATEQQENHPAHREAEIDQLRDVLICVYKTLTICSAALNRFGVRNELNGYELFSALTEKE